MKKIVGILLACAMVLGLFAFIPQIARATEVVRGDFNGDEEVTAADAIYVLYYTFYPEDYPINQPADLNGDEEVTAADAIYLLYFTFYPEDYPLPAIATGDDYQLEDDELPPIIRPDEA